MTRSAPIATFSRRQALGLIALAGTGRTTAQVPEGGYRFSPVPQQAIPLVAAYWNPILAWVSQKSGVKLSLKISRTSAETTAYV
ncbi:MAG: hypothetical protein JNM08_18180, partial [Rubrivivax sp.]|nr:hypothetical protein [Rubrivivax sp.]